MIYLYKNNFNEIVTDNVINFIPNTLEIFLNDTKLGDYLNYSTSLLYLYFDIPSIDLINFQEKEYKIKIYNYSALIKEELCYLKDNTINIIVNEFNSEKKIRYYERR